MLKWQISPPVTHRYIRNSWLVVLASTALLGCSYLPLPLLEDYIAITPFQGHYTWGDDSPVARWNLAAGFLAWPVGMTDFEVDLRVVEDEYVSYVALSGGRIFYNGAWQTMVGVGISYSRDDVDSNIGWFATSWTMYEISEALLLGLRVDISERSGLLVSGAIGARMGPRR